MKVFEVKDLPAEVSEIHISCSLIAHNSQLRLCATWKPWIYGVTSGFLSLSTEIFFFPFGDEVGDSRLRNNLDYSDTQFTEYISPTIRPSAGFPFWGEFFYGLYVSIAKYVTCGSILC